MTQHTTPTSPATAAPDGLSAGPAAARPADAGARLPVQLIALGRGRVGKTAFLNTVAQWFGPLNPALQVWNADGHNATHSLANFHPGALSPTAHTLDDLRG